LFGVINTGSRIPKSREAEYLKEIAALMRDFRRMLGLRHPDLPLLTAATGNVSIYSTVSGWASRLNRLKKLLHRLKRQAFRRDFT
jgi:hypothetical protein